MKDKEIKQFEGELLQFAREMQAWKQARHKPSSATKTRFKVVKQHPEILS